MNAIQKFDENAMLAVRKLHHPAPLWAFRALTWTGTGYCWLAVAVALNLAHRRSAVIVEKQELFLQAMVPSLGTYFAGNLLKRLIERKRPENAIPGYKAFGMNPGCGSFPSGHAAAAFAFFTGLLVLGHPLAWPVFAWALLVSFSRFYLGVHFPTDILGGAALGIAFGLAVNVFRRLLTF